MRHKRRNAAVQLLKEVLRKAKRISEFKDVKRYSKDKKRRKKFQLITSQEPGKKLKL